MTQRRTTLVRMIGVILVLLGVLWTLQGSGVVGGSSMTGERTWLIAGVIVLVVGIGLLAWTASAARNRGGGDRHSSGP